jgi:hypothetical protein
LKELDPLFYHRKVEDVSSCAHTKQNLAADNVPEVFLAMTHHSLSVMALQLSIVVGDAHTEAFNQENSLLIGTPAELTRAVKFFCQHLSLSKRGRSSTTPV